MPVPTRQTPALPRIRLVAGAVDTTVAVAAFVGARLRGARLFHPRGRVFDGTLTVPGTPDKRYRVPLLDRAGNHEVIVRLSKCGSTPGGLPDVLGLAIRLEHPPGAVGSAPRPFDLLLATAPAEPGLRRLLLVPRCQFAVAYGSLLPYRMGGRVRVLGAFPDGTSRGRGASLDDAVALVRGPGLGFHLAEAATFGDWRTFAHLALRPREPAGDDHNLCFDPVLNSLPTLHPTGWLNALRRPAYEGSQYGRDAPCAPDLASNT